MDIFREIELKADSPCLENKVSGYRTDDSSKGPTTVY